MTEWRKSSRSSDPNGLACVEVAKAEGVLIRDSKDKGGEVLSFTDAEWQMLINRIKSGTYNQSGIPNL